MLRGLVCICFDTIKQVMSADITQAVSLVSEEDCTLIECKLGTHLKLKKKKNPIPMGSDPVTEKK